MVQAGWVKSSAGRAAAISSPTQLEARLLEVVEATEGPTSDGRCVMRDGPCPGEVTCPIHAIWVEGAPSSSTGSTTFSHCTHSMEVFTDDTDNH